MLEIIESVIFVVFLNLAVRYGSYLERRKAKLDFKWICTEKNCGFQMESTDLAVLTKLGADHKRWSHGQAKTL